jgi:hypothetical protein
LHGNWPISEESIDIEVLAICNAVGKVLVAVCCSKKPVLVYVLIFARADSLTNFGYDAAMCGICAHDSIRSEAQTREEQVLPMPGTKSAHL